MLPLIYSKDVLLDFQLPNLIKQIDKTFYFIPVR